jgi:hypothetical protein
MPRKKTAAFKCEKCGKRFAMAMHLGRHRATQHGQAPGRSATPTTAKMAGKTAAAAQLVSLIVRLRGERQEHVDAIAGIDATFEQFGITAAPAKRRGRPRETTRAAKPGRRPKAAKKAAKKARRKARGHFSMTANESILQFVTSAGKKGAPGAEIVKHLKAEGRGAAGAYVTIGKLVKAGTLKKEKIKGGQGSRYAVA